jgi:hypothetical protein
MEPLGWIAAGLRPYGLVLRGGFHPEPADAVPPLADGRPARTLAMIGNIGAAGGDPMWRAFAQARARYAGADPLNCWIRDAVTPVARAAGAAALFPFEGPPYLPFQRWAMRAEPVFPSPLGLLIHPVHGLWHAYRAALVFAEHIALPPRAAVRSPCEGCAEKPCLAACPVRAFDAKGYDVPGCVAFLDSGEGADCMERGCRARRACPVGRTCAHEPPQAEFHMRAFRRSVTRTK